MLLDRGCLSAIFLLPWTCNKSSIAPHFSTHGISSSFFFQTSPKPQSRGSWAAGCTPGYANGAFGPLGQGITTEDQSPQWVL